MIYFAYGSNLNPGQMFERCPAHRTIGVARLPGHRLGFPRYSRMRACATAGIESHATESVWGALYRLSEDDIPTLHHFEGYDPFGPADANRHVLEEVAVMRPGASPQSAMSYVAVPDGTKQLPSRHYMEIIVDGARYHGLPKAWLRFLETVATAP